MTPTQSSYLKSRGRGLNDTNWKCLFSGVPCSTDLLCNPGQRDTNADTAPTPLFFSIGSELSCSSTLSLLHTDTQTQSCMAGWLAGWLGGRVAG